MANRWYVVELPTLPTPCWSRILPSAGAFQSAKTTPTPLPRVRSPAEGFCYETPLRQPWGANTQSVVGDDHKKKSLQRNQYKSCFHDGTSKNLPWPRQCLGRLLARLTAWALRATVVDQPCQREWKVWLRNIWGKCLCKQEDKWGRRVEEE